MCFEEAKSYLEEASPVDMDSISSWSGVGATKAVFRLSKFENLCLLVQKNEMGARDVLKNEVEISQLLSKYHCLVPRHGEIFELVLSSKAKGLQEDGYLVLLMSWVIGIGTFEATLRGFAAPPKNESTFLETPLGVLIAKITKDKWGKAAASLSAYLNFITESGKYVADMEFMLVDSGDLVLMDFGGGLSDRKLADLKIKLANAAEALKRFSNE